MTEKTKKICRKTKIVIAKFTVGGKTEGVIIEYEPNYITGITIIPNEMMPPARYADNKRQRIFQIPNLKHCREKLP